MISRPARAARPALPGTNAPRLCGVTFIVPRLCGVTFIAPRLCGVTFIAPGSRSVALIAPRLRGFTLIELMVVVAIVAILAAIAIPAYGDYIKRSKIIDATSKLANCRVRMEQYFLDNRKYTDSCGAGLACDTTVHADDSFQLSCPGAPDASTYKVLATGIATKGMSGFQYSIDQANVKKTEALPAGWGPAPAACWAIRKDGSCS